MLSCVYAFMKDNTTSMYKLTEILRKALDFGHLPILKIIMMDFESSAMSAVASFLGASVEIKGCFFHVCQSTWRRVQQLNLATDYKKNEEV